MPNRSEGYLMIDHRASPGLPEGFAEKVMGRPSSEFREGTVFEAATLGCAHCRTPQLKNPLRIRERGFCGKCNEYVCDLCTGVMRTSGYVHRSFEELADLVRSGKFVLSGGSACNPILTPVKETTDG